MKIFLRLVIMMSILGIGVIVARGLVPNLFPDTVNYPRTDTTPGTLGAIFTKLLGPGFAGNGTLPNTLALNGRGSGDYLKRTPPCPNPTHVWTGITNDGYPVCGLRTKMLARYGVIRDLENFGGSVKVFPAGGSAYEPAYNGRIVYEDDIISTDMGATVAVEFDDTSILRLNVDTTVQIQQGLNVGGDLIAQVIINNGSLWGRVLTSTGMNFGTNEYIAGVRGTSISIQETWPGMFDMMIVHSLYNQPGENVFDMMRNLEGGNSNNAWFDALLFDMIHKTIGSNVRIGPTSVYSYGSRSLDEMYHDVWIRQNTIKDIAYFRDVLKLQKKLATGIPLFDIELARISSESGITLPPSDNISILQSLCDYSETNKIFWRSLVNIETDPCRDESLIAMMDYENIPVDPQGHLFTSTGNIKIDLSSKGYNPTAEGVKINKLGALSLSGVLIYSGVNLLSNVRSISVTFTDASNRTFNGNALVFQEGAGGPICRYYWNSTWKKLSGPCTFDITYQDPNTFTVTTGVGPKTLNQICIGNLCSGSPYGINDTLKQFLVRK